MDQHRKLLPLGIGGIRVLLPVAERDQGKAAAIKRHAVRCNAGRDVHDAAIHFVMVGPGTNSALQPNSFGSDAECHVDSGFKSTRNPKRLSTASNPHAAE